MLLCFLFVDFMDLNSIRVNENNITQDCTQISFLNILEICFVVVLFDVFLCFF